MRVTITTAPGRKKPKASDRRFLKGRQVWQVRQQEIVDDPLYGRCYLVRSGKTVWEWVDEGSEKDRQHQRRKRLEEIKQEAAGHEQ